MVSLTLAQYRLLGRAIRGDVLPMSRYRKQHATVAALLRKGCLRGKDTWEASPLGKKVHTARGRLRPGREVYDSATPQERQALGRSHTPYASKEEQHVAEQLRHRMREAGEIPA